MRTLTWEALCCIKHICERAVQFVGSLRARRKAFSGGPRHDGQRRTKVINRNLVIAISRSLTKEHMHSAYKEEFWKCCFITEQWRYQAASDTIFE